MVYVNPSAKLNATDNFLSSADHCSYKYVTQLSYFPNCDPFIEKLMILNCTVEVPLQATEITIGWFINSMELNSSNIVSISSGIDIGTGFRRIHSQLKIVNMTDDFVGEYTCKMLGDDEEFIPSDSLRIDHDELELHYGLGPCDNGNVFGHSPPQKCGDKITLSTLTPLPLSTPPTPIAPTSFAPTSIAHTSVAPTFVTILRYLLLPTITFMLLVLLIYCTSYHLAVSYPPPPNTRTLFVSDVQHAATRALTHLAS